jgi:hypothetical protein
MPWTRSGYDVMLWCGQMHTIPLIRDFTGCEAEANCPGGILTIKAPSGNIYVKPDQWIAITPSGIQVVGDDEIDFDG